MASLPYKPDFKVMPEGWDGTTRDPDEVLYEISMKEDHMLHEEFVQRLEFNKKKVWNVGYLPLPIHFQLAMVCILNAWRLIFLVFFYMLI